MPVISDVVIKLSADTAEMRSQLERLRTDFEKFTHGASRAFADMGNSAKRVFEIFTGVSLHGFVEQMARATVEAVKMARAAELAEYSFEQLAQQANISGRALIRSLEEASGHTIDVSDALGAAALGRGLPPLRGDDGGRCLAAE